MNSTFKSLILTCLLFSVNTGLLFSQVEGKREMRATWVATVSNIDWPLFSDRGDPAAQKADLIEKLELYKSININAIFLQVRTECDAFYNSAYEPWSRFLSTSQGDDPGYDPLQFAIDEAHKRGIEVHAWMNPYRISASSSPGAGYFHPDHVYSEHPEWAIAYSSGRLILNPGLPEVMTYIGAVVRDMCSKYAVDGVHFDDYFYAYEGTDASLDADAYALYGNGMSLGDWRRDNVNRMIDTVYRNILEVRPTARFGVSPFGIYKPGIPEGIAGLNAWNQIYCDPLAWLEDQTIDYLTPQMYWPTGGSQDFETLANWWTDQVNAKNRHLYAGQASYRLADNPGVKKSADEDLHEYKSYVDKYVSDDGELLDLSMLESGLKKSTSDPVAAWTIGQLGLQVDIIRSRAADGGLGSVFFSASDFERVTGLADYMALNKYTHPAIVPEMTWRTGDIPSTPASLAIEMISEEYCLSWDYTGGINDRFAIYISEDETDPVLIIENADNLSKIVFNNYVRLSDLDYSGGSAIVVTAVSAIGKESLPSSVYNIDFGPDAILSSPANAATVARNMAFSWTGSEEGLEYRIQVSRNQNFSSLAYESSWTTGKLASLSAMNLPGETEYFWRVKARSDLEGAWSETRSFVTGYPTLPLITYPTNLLQNVNNFTRFEWVASSAAGQVEVEISESPSFSSLINNEIFDAASGSGRLSTGLEKDSWYYARMISRNAYGDSEYSEVISFKTTAGEIPCVNIIQPDNEAVMSSFDSFEWSVCSSTGTNTYMLEIASDAEFKSIMSSTGWISATGVELGMMNLEGQRNYFWRVKPKSEFGEGEYSDTREFEAAYPARPTLTAPAQLSTDNDVRVEVGWEGNSVTDSVLLQFSTDGNFNTVNHSETLAYSPSTANINGRLQEYTWYFVRAAAKNNYGYSVFSSSKYFETGKDNYVGIQEDSKSGLSIFPNPVNGSGITIMCDFDINKILITDPAGRIIYSDEFKSATVQGIRKIALPSSIFTDAGIYYVGLVCKETKLNKAVMVLK